MTTGKPKINERDITGLKYFDQLAPLLERLHNDGCERDRAGNRELHYDQYCMLLLLYLFNPIVTSLRGVQQASELKKVQKKLGCKRAALGSLSEATSVFDADRLKEIIAELGDQLQPLAQDKRLRDIQQTITLVDGSLIAALPKIMEASWRKATDGNGMVKWRLHTHFELLRGVPTRIDVTPNGGGQHDERAMLATAIESDRLYVTDRGYAKFTLFNQIVTAKSSYVCRLRDNSVWTAVEEKYRNEEAELDEIISDEIVEFSKGSGLDHRVRVICIRINPHTSRGKYRGGSSGVDSDGILRIATNLLDVPADIIGLLFSYRWAVEIFFRFFKHILGCRHLLSHDQNGIEIQTYCAIIACMLIALWTGKKPTLRTYEMICFYFTGLADEDELMQHIEKLKPQAA
ncbi:MAG: IS4 family transposase [Planctomycetaceae bacterium]|nr:IS4 family transposase [Planctomycetaceae bacterium]MCB9926415.1 IS4 family transposase [Planctomycetaceae bacterium]